ncbi:MAG: hypothetical protein ACFFDM_05680 [Candidatus Thorarchaeota archaeon]
MSAVNEGVFETPIKMKEPTPHPRKRRFLRKVKDQNRPKVKAVCKGCHNCSHHLSKFYYWKESPCDTCFRSPAYYYYSPTLHLPDRWDERMTKTSIRRNSLY